MCDLTMAKGAQYFIIFLILFYTINFVLDSHAITARKIFLIGCKSISKMIIHFDFDIDVKKNSKSMRHCELKVTVEYDLRETWVG